MPYPLEGFVRHHLESSLGSFQCLSSTEMSPFGLHRLLQVLQTNIHGLPYP